MKGVTILLVLALAAGIAGYVIRDSNKQASAIFFTVAAIFAVWFVLGLTVL
ncbi:MAG: hypothetical protein ACR2RB_20755 [Gammaproteobacteria bacterium]